MVMAGAMLQRRHARLFMARNHGSAIRVDRVSYLRGADPRTWGIWRAGPGRI